MYNDWLLPLLRQFRLIPIRITVISLWISEWIVLPPALINSAGVLLTIPGDVCLFIYSVATSNSKAHGLGTSGPSVCTTYMCLPNMYNEQLGEMDSPPNQNTVGVCNQTTPLILYYTDSTVVTLLKINAPIQVSYTFYLTVSFKFINFSFQIFFLFVPETIAF
jgi:hypothetical protein